MDTEFKVTQDGRLEIGKRAPTGVERGGGLMRSLVFVSRWLPVLHRWTSG